jgi:hypothetical protein
MLRHDHQQLAAALADAHKQLEEAAEQLDAAQVQVEQVESRRLAVAAAAQEQAIAAADARGQLKKLKVEAKQVGMLHVQDVMCNQTKMYVLKIMIVYLFV